MPITAHPLGRSAALWTKPPAQWKLKSGHPEAAVLRGARQRGVAPCLSLRRAAVLVGRPGPAPPCLQSRALSVASPAQGGLGKTGVWLRLVRGTWLCRVPVKVKDTFLNSGLELFNHSILKSKYFLWHFDSWTALKFRNSSPKRNTKNCSELGGSRTLKSFYLLRACVCAVGNCELSSLGRSSEPAWFVPREDALAFPGVCVSVTETEITWRRVTSTGVLSALIWKPCWLILL